MIVLGIDPGTATTGYGIIKYCGNKLTPIDCGVILTQASLDMPTRLSIIHSKLQLIIDQYKPEHMAVEDLYFSKNTKTGLSVGHARGVVLLSGKENNLLIGEYTPLQVKQAVVGYGRAEKSQVQKMVTIILGLSETPKPDDAADALAIALTHAVSYKIRNLA